MRTLAATDIQTLGEVNGIFPVPGVVGARRDGSGGSETMSEGKQRDEGEARMQALEVRESSHECSDGRIFLCMIQTATSPRMLDIYTAMLSKVKLAVVEAMMARSDLHTTENI